MYDIHVELGAANISDLVRKEIHGIFETNKPTKDQIRKYKRPGKVWFIDDIYTYACSDLF